MEIPHKLLIQLTLLILENKYCTCCYVTLTSPLVTNYGQTGPLEVCPGSGLFVTGMQLKSEPIAEAQDNTALNGIAFHCNSPLCGVAPGSSSPTHNQPTSTQLTSTVGQWGSWGSNYMCPNYGYVVGFQMRSQKEQDEGDDTASNNLRIVCNDGSGKLTVFEGDGTNLGHWTEPQLCPQGMAFTGMQTQVENGEDSDHTALNRLFAYCTNAPFSC